MHILPWDGRPPEEVPAGTLPEAAVALLTGPPPLMLCGTGLRHTWPGAPRPAGVRVSRRQAARFLPYPLIRFWL